MTGSGPHSARDRSLPRRFSILFGSGDPRRLALFRIFLCGSFLALGLPALLSISLGLVLLGVFGRFFSLVAAVLAGAAWVGDGQELSTLELVRLAVPLAILIFSRAWDAYSFDSLWGLYFWGRNDEATLRRREARGVYRWPLAAAGLFALLYYGFVIAAPRIVPGWEGGAALSIWDGVWVLPLVVPLHKFLDALARRIRSLYPASPRYVIYDGDCCFCTRTAMVLRRLDALELLRFIDFRRELEEVGTDCRRDLTAEDCEREMFFSSKRGNHGGFYGFRAMAWSIPLAWLAAPLLYLPGVARIGVPAYRFVAENRMNIPIRDTGGE